MVTAINMGNETKITRRIIAEDNDWTLQVILRNLKYLPKFFLKKIFFFKSLLE